MELMLIELPVDMKDFVEQRVNDEDFASPSEFFQKLIAREIRRQEIDRTLQEALDEDEGGGSSEWKPGDTRRLFEELVQRRRPTGPNDSRTS
jgi:Arc/MetJ-type ribon-helix-helix transcriptional regulator